MHVVVRAADSYRNVSAVAYYSANVSMDPWSDKYREKCFAAFYGKYYV